MNCHQSFVLADYLEGFHGGEMQEIDPEMLGLDPANESPFKGKTGGGQVGQRLADGHAAGSRGVEHGERRPFAHGEGFAEVALVAHRGDGHVDFTGAAIGRDIYTGNLPAS